MVNRLHPKQSYDRRGQRSALVTITHEYTTLNLFEWAWNLVAVGSGGNKSCLKQRWPPFSFEYSNQCDCRGS